MARIALLAALAVAALAPAAYAETVTVSLGGQDVGIEYTATDLVVNSARLTDTSLLLDVTSTGNPSSLVITLERSVIDTPERSGAQESYIVLEDAFEIETVEESDATAISRTLRIPVSTGIGEIEIVGGIVGGALAQEAPAPPVPDVVPDTADVADPADVATEPPVDAPVEEPEAPPPAEPEPPAVEAAPPAEPEPPAEPAPPAEPEPPADPAPAEMERPGDGTAMAGPGGTAGTAQPSTCGPGTVLADDGVTCVLSPAAERGPVSYRELAFGAGAGVVISLVAAAIMYGIGRAGRP